MYSLRHRISLLSSFSQVPQKTQFLGIVIYRLQDLLLCQRRRQRLPLFLSSTLELPSPNLDQNRFFEPLQLSCNSWAYPPVIGGKKAISDAPSIEALKSVTIF